MFLSLGCEHGCDHSSLELPVGGSIGQEDGQEFETPVVFELGSRTSFSLHPSHSHVPFSEKVS